jgi:hypothetical protein
MNVSDADRITVEDSPVRMLDPADPIFNKPNKITEADFQGWVQERGLLMNVEPQYKALLSETILGKTEERGMLYTRYGGHYIYRLCVVPPTPAEFLGHTGSCQHAQP